VLCAKANKTFMRTVQQNMFLILNRVPVTFVTDPELIRPSIPDMTHSLDQKTKCSGAEERKKDTSSSNQQGNAKENTWHQARSMKHAA